MFVAPISPASPELPKRYQYPGALRGRGGALEHGFPNRSSPHGAPRVAALDGLRGIAILGVVAFHAGVLPGGFLGVDLFFVLSGFLITGLLLREQHDSGNICIRQFWTQRARRLVPAVLALVAAVQLWARTNAAPSELPVVNGQSAAAMVYGSNWFNILFDVGYWNVGLGNSPLNHLWSLAIEEQFYILFPLLVFLALVRGKLQPRPFAWLTLALAIASFALTPLLFEKLGTNRAYFGTDTRVGAILLGATLAAWVTARTAKLRRLTTENSVRSVSRTAAPAIPLSPNSAQVSSVVTIGAGAQRLFVTAGAAAAVVLLVLWGVMTTASSSLYRGGLALHALASVSIIATVVMAPLGTFAGVLRWRPLVWLGERSYSLYLWHWPLIVVLTPASTGLEGLMLVGVVALAIVVATLVSYELIEHPIRYSKLQGMKLVTSLSVPAVIIASSALFFQPPLPPAFGSDALVAPARGDIRLMLVGDSWALNLGVALATVDSAHQMSILNMGKGGCGITDAKRQRTPDKGDFETAYDCLQWHKTWRAVVEAFRPQVAILNVGNWDQAPQDFDGTGEFVGACSALFAERYSRQLDTAIALLQQRDARVFVLTIRDNDARAGSGPDCMNTLLRATAARHASQGVTLLDLYAQLCADHRCPDIVNGDAVYDVTGHLAPRAQQRIATWVLNNVNASLSVP